MVFTFLAYFTLDRDGEDMWTQGLFISMYEKIHYKKKKTKQNKEQTKNNNKNKNNSKKK